MFPTPNKLLIHTIRTERDQSAMRRHLLKEITRGRSGPGRSGGERRRIFAWIKARVISLAQMQEIPKTPASPSTRIYQGPSHG